MNEKKIRFTLIDQLRGSAVLLMIIFHFLYDLNYFDIINIGSKEKFLPEFSHIIITTFLVSVGLSLALVHGKNIKWGKFLHRLGILIVFSAAISISTYILFPNRWIYFGTLHSITITSILALPLLRFPNLCLMLAGLLLISEYADLGIPWFTLSHVSMDYIPPFPWLFAVFLGVFLYSIRFHKIQFTLPLVESTVQFLGKHALIVYLLHQPLLFGLIYGYVNFIIPTVR